MKSVLLALTLTSLLFSAASQTKVTIEADLGVGNQAIIVTDGTDIPVPTTLTKLDNFKLSYKGLKLGEKLVIKVSGVTLVSGGPAEYLFGDTVSPKLFTFKDNIINKQISINHEPATGTGGTPLLFIFSQTGAVATVTPPKGDSSLGPITVYLNTIIRNYEFTPLGWVRETSGMDVKERRKHANITHIFFDEFGNSLLGAIPQGIANRQYIVHIIYRGYLNIQGNARYSVKQTAGSFSSALNINNAGAINNLPSFQSKVGNKPFDTWREDLYPLGISTDNIVFDIIVVVDNGTINPGNVILQTQTIKMSPVYHATIDVGLVNSELVNPTFSLVDAPDGSGNKVVKETDRSSQGIVTIMATFYTSPVVLIEKLFQKRIKKNIPNYKLTGRSLFDDHSLIERIYPTLGVSVSSKSFENLFFGLNWEIARGLSVFAGGHWGKVNTFEMPNFVPGTTPVTPEEFEFYKNTTWKVAWSYGAKVDVAIVTNLFK